MAVTKRFPHQIVTMVGEDLNNFIRERAERTEVSIAEVTRDLMERSRQEIETEDRSELAPSGV